MLFSGFNIAYFLTQTRFFKKIVYLHRVSKGLIALEKQSSMIFWRGSSAG